MFGIGMPEILLILAIALIVIGPKKLPDLAKTLGRAMGEFKKATQDFKRSIDIEETIKEFNEPVEPLNTELKNAVDDAEKEENHDWESNDTEKVSDELDDSDISEPSEPSDRSDKSDKSDKSEPSHKVSSNDNNKGPEK